MEGVDIAVMAGLIVKVLSDEYRKYRNGNGVARFEEALTKLTERMQAAEDKADTTHGDLHDRISVTAADLAFVKGRLKGLPQGPEA